MLFKIAIVVLPVFVLIALGFISSYLHLLTRYLVDGLAKFCQDFGIPLLLFFNLAILDLSSAFNIELLIFFYISMILSFIIISCIAYFIFKQPYNNSIILGFCAMFSNGVLLGLPISELAFGTDSLFINYTIIIGHITDKSMYIMIIFGGISVVIMLKSLICIFCIKRKK